MDKYAAGKLEGLLLATRRHLEYVADHLREVSPPEKLRDRMLMISTALAEIVHLSWEIYDEHPELNPDLDAERATAENKRNRAPSSQG